MATKMGQAEDSVEPQPKASHRVRMVLIGVVVMLIVAELFSRAIASNLPSPLQWHSYEAQRKVQEIDALSKRGGTQLAFLGSSIVDIGVDPAVIDREIGGGLSSYNAGLASSIPRMSATWAESVVIPRLHPKVIVLGLGGYDFGDEEPGRAAIYDAFLNSSGEKQARHDASVLQTVNRWIGDYSSLWRHKFELRDPETVLRAITGRAQPVDLEAKDLEPDGRQTENQYDAFTDRPTLDVSQWKLGTLDVAATEQLISYARAKGIGVVLVVMPVTNQFVARFPGRESDYLSFVAAVKALGARTDTPVLDYDAMRDIKYFGDEVHLNYTGSQLFSARLGTALKTSLPRQ